MKTTLNKKAAGFSLVEMLVVIAVIGIIAAIAVPMIGNITGKAETNTHRRNAQNIASVYSAAVAAGFSGSADEDAAVTAVTSAPGIQGDGEFAGTYFYVPNVSNTTEAKKYLSWDGTASVLVYSKTASP